MVDRTAIARTEASIETTPELSIETVAFDDPAAQALREAMTAEMRLRYWDRFIARQPLAWRCRPTRRSGPGSPATRLDCR